MEFCALASGSSGNCFYVGNASTGILVDVGISAKQVIQRMISIGIDPTKLRAIFVTHEHIDHIRGVDVLARKLNVPIFATAATLRDAFICKNVSLLHPIKTDATVKIADLTIESFSKFHSAIDPVSFAVTHTKRVAIITDAGHACANIKKQVSACDLLCIESNHDEEMLHNGPYAPYLKKWIKGDKGHLSNKQAAECVRECASEKLKAVVLSHLSHTNNTPQKALDTFQKIVLQQANFAPSFTVSHREQPTPVFTL